jgi:hypothetical protein
VEDHALGGLRPDRGATPLKEESGWIRDAIERFCRDQTPLNDDAAARLLADAELLELRDTTAWGLMSQTDAKTHGALWRDLTRWAPDGVRTPAAALLGFSSWLSGNGAQAWTAVDLIPDPNNYTLARLTETTLQEAIPPGVWKNVDASATASTLGSIALQRAHLAQPGPTNRPSCPHPDPSRVRPPAPDR